MEPYMLDSNVEGIVSWDTVIIMIQLEAVRYNLDVVWKRPSSLYLFTIWIETCIII